MPMNQRTTLPPLGPAAVAIGAGVMATRRRGGRRRAVGAAASDAGAVVAGAEPPQAAATMATIPAATIKARGPER